MALDFSEEYVLGYPVSRDNISTGKISAANITTNVEMPSGVMFSGSLSYPTVTITFRGIPDPPPLERVTASNFAAQSFTFRGKTYRATAAGGSKYFFIGGQRCIDEWTLTGVDLSTPLIEV